LGVHQGDGHIINFNEASVKVVKVGKVVKLEVERRSGPLVKITLNGVADALFGK
jgi:phosphoribosylformylglycinamidine (FGAM) synthase PurS component